MAHASNPHGIATGARREADVIALLLRPWVVAAVSLALVVATVAVRRRGTGFSPWRAGVLAVSFPIAAGCPWLAALGERWPYACDAVRFGRPWWLAVSGGALVIVLSRVSTLPRALSAGRRRIMALTAGLAVLAAALAVAQPEWGHPIDRLTVVLTIDRSRSMDLVTNAAQRAHDEERLATASMRDDDRVARVVFGADVVTEDPVHPRAAPTSAQDVAVGADGTDLGAAIRRALAEIPDESTGRIALVTDGASNRGDPLGAAAAASAAGVPVDVLALTPREQRNLRVDAVRAPVAAAAGESFELRVVTRSSVAADVDVRVSIDGHRAETGRAHIAAGEDVLTLRQTAPSAGLHRYEVDVTAVDPAVDAVVQDNRAGTFLRVRGASSVLILEGDPGHGAALATALQHAAFATAERTATGFPDDLASLAAYDLVVLSDVPARALAPEQMEQLATYVRDLGGGLLLMGGDRSMGPGGYARTPIEEVSPVSFDMRQERRRASLAQVIAIDFSGSMAAVVPTGQTKLQLANEAAARSALLLGAGDRLGVMHIDTEVHWTVPLEPIGDANHVRSIGQRIRAVGPSGGGIIIPVTLTESYRALSQQNANLRHLLLFSDGSDSEEIAGQATVVADAFRRGITTSVVSMGRGSDTPELEHLSREGHGRFYLVEDATRLPAVFAQETVLAARSSIREEPFRPTLGVPDVVTRGVDFARGPPLRGWVVTIPKPRASILLHGPDHDPILAAWQVGVGRVAAFMSDAKDRWGVDWLTWPEASQLWAELARSLVRRSDPLVRVEADTVGGVLHVHADARTGDGYADSLRRLTAQVRGPDGSVRDLALDPVGAGTYSAEVPLDRPGAYAMGVRDDALGTLVATGGAILLEGEELRPASDPLLLERIAAMTGGRMRASLADEFRERVALRRAYTPLAPTLLWAAAALMFASLLARRLAAPGLVTRMLEARRSRALATVSQRVAPVNAASAAVAALLARKQARRAPARTDEAAASPTPSRSAPTLVPPEVHAAERPPATAADDHPPPPPSPPAALPVGTGSSNLDALLAKKRKRR